MLTGSALAESDDRQRKISQLDQSIVMIAGLDPYKALKYVGERVELLIEEGSYDPSELVRTELDAFQICMQERSGQLIGQAPWWISEAYLHSVLARGERHPQSIKLQRLMEDPCSLPAIQDGIASGRLPKTFREQCEAEWNE